MRILGNSGSHAAADIPRADVITGGRVLCLAIRLLYPDPHDAQAHADAARWIKNKRI